MKLTNLQTQTVNSLTDTSLSILQAHNNQDSSTSKNIYLKAPTGSGKTFMVLNYIDQMIEYTRATQDRLVFVVVTLSSAELPKQLYNDFHSYLSHLKNPDLDINLHISPTASKSSKTGDTYFEIHTSQNKVHIMGGASFNAKALYTKHHTLENFINEVQDLGLKLVYIRDEAHVGASSRGTTKLSEFEQKLQESAHIVLKLTATPNLIDGTLVELSESDLQEETRVLIKRDGHFNPGINSFSNEILTVDILDVACQKFLEIKQRYLDATLEPGLVGINPAMIIQVDNDSSNWELSEQFQKAIVQIEQTLNKHQLSYVKWFGDEKGSQNESSSRLVENQSLQDISLNNSPFDVIIIKIGPAVGWNIPRACMLVQLRNVSSSQLQTQTLGRIKRNPNPDFIMKHTPSIGHSFFVYSNVKSTIDVFFSVEKIKAKFANEKFFVGQLHLPEEMNLEESHFRHFEKEVEALFGGLFESGNVYSINYNPQWIDENLTKKVEEYRQQIENSQGTLVVESKMYGVSKVITTSITNTLELQDYVLNQRFKFKSILTPYINTLINHLLNDVKKLHPKGDANLYLLYELVIYTTWLPKVLSIYKEIQKSITDNRVIYNLTQKVALPQVLTFIDREVTNTKNKDIKNTKVIKKQYSKVIPLNDFYTHEFIGATQDFVVESRNEYYFFQKLIDYFNENPLSHKIDFWFRNPSGKGIRLEYLRNNKKVVHYPDVLMKSGNHYLYIEIKGMGDKDINADKTKQLIESYGQYVEDFKELVKSNPELGVDEKGEKYTISLLVAKISIKEGRATKKNDDFIVYEGHSTNNELNEMLKVAKGRVKREVSLDDILHVIK